MIIAIDFDGTIVEHQFPGIGKEMPHAFDTLIKWQAQGHKLILWTCRNQDELYEGRDLLQEAVTYCESKGFEFDAINCNSGDIDFNPEPKVYADLYIDDRANFTKIDWRYFDLLMDEKIGYGVTTGYTVNYIQDYTGIHDIRKRTRQRQLVDARAVAMAILKKKTRKSLHTIGVEMGGFDHATVLSSVKKVNNLRIADREFARYYAPVFEHFNM